MNYRHPPTSLHFHRELIHCRRHNFITYWPDELFPQKLFVVPADIKTFLPPIILRSWIWGQFKHGCSKTKSEDRTLSKMTGLSETKIKGANFGVDAFLGPSFYKSEALVKYVYENVKEMQEIVELGWAKVAFKFIPTCGCWSLRLHWFLVIPVRP